MREQRRGRNYPIHHCDSITSSSVPLSHASFQLLHHTTDRLFKGGLSLSYPKYIHINAGFPPKNTLYLFRLKGLLVFFFFFCTIEPINYRLCILYIIASHLRELTC